MKQILKLVKNVTKHFYFPDLIHTSNLVQVKLDKSVICVKKQFSSLTGLNAHKHDEHNKRIQILKIEYLVQTFELKLEKDSIWVLKNI